MARGVAKAAREKEKAVQAAGKKRQQRAYDAAKAIRLS